MSTDVRRRDRSTSEVGDIYGMSRQTVVQLIHQGSFGPRGKGFRVINPEAKRPQYRITPAGLEFYERVSA